jgi:hypothetical protein
VDSKKSLTTELQVTSHTVDCLTHSHTQSQEEATLDKTTRIPSLVYFIQIVNKTNISHFLLCSFFFNSLSVFSYFFFSFIFLSFFILLMSLPSVSIPSASELEAESRDLPSGWFVGWSNTHRRRYYYIPPTAQSKEIKQWEPPQTAPQKEQVVTHKEVSDTI